ncbi:MAG: hypothetical protein SFZ23_09940 [Planctomycetota bacterium]|nr:hypothetical protein [Planctomycetota bacterium]
MAIFGSKKAAEGPAEEPAGRDPTKAARFFAHAKTVQETGNAEYAISLWLSGLRFDPENAEAMSGLFTCVKAFRAEHGEKKSLARETLAGLSGKGDVDRALTALIEWAMRQTDLSLAIRAVELTSKAKLTLATTYIAERGFAQMAAEKRPRKDYYLKLSEAFSSVGKFEKAIQAAESAYKLDPTDAQLSTSIRNLSAQAAMNRGGFDQVGQAGGFRQNIRDADKQRRLEEEDRLGRTDEATDRLITAAEIDYKSRPSDVAALEKYVRLLLQRGHSADEDRAQALLLRGYEETQQFRLRQTAGEIKIRQLRRKSQEAQKAATEAPGDKEAAAAAQLLSDELVKLEIDELRLQEKAYPTNLQIKYELGKRFVLAGQYGDAIPFLQDAQNDPKNRAAVMNMLGLAFLKIDYLGESIEMFRQGLEVRDTGEELQMELRYHLMAALAAKAEADRDLSVAEEADKIASMITIKQFNYRDVRQRREAIKKLITSIKNPAPLG